MADFDEQLPLLAFPQELDELSISTGSTDPFDIVVRIGSQYGTAVIDTTLYPETDGTVTLTDLAELLRDNLPDAKATEVYFGLDDHSESVVVIPSRADISDTATDFALYHFLTLLDGAKPTYIGATEYLAFHKPRIITNPLPPSPTITCLWVNPETGATRETAGQVRTVTHMANNLYNACFAPQDFQNPGEGFLLHSFTVEMDARRQEYIIHTPIDCDPFSLKFYNNFGQLETFHCFGTKEKELKPTRSTASFSGKTRNYKIEAVPTWKCHTGILPESVQPLFADLCAAKHVWREDNSREVTITDNELKLSNDRYEVQTGTVTFRETARTAMHRKQNVPQEVFDDTFDDTFE